MDDENHDPAGGPWHVSKRIPVAMLAGLALQTLVLVFWVGQLAQRVTSLEESRVASSDGPGRIIRVETQLDDVKRTLDKLDIKIDRLIQRPVQ